MMSSRSDHHSFAETLRLRVLEGPGETDAALRQRVAARTADGPPLEASYDDLARQIGESAWRVRTHRWRASSRLREARRPPSSSSRPRQREPDGSAGSGPSRLWKRPAMRLPEINRGDGFTNRLLIGFISIVSGMRLPDAARVAFYHKNFFGTPMGAWTQATMRGPSMSVGERELMAAMVAKWNSCAFGVGAHGAVAAKAMERPLVDAVLADFCSAPISEALKGALAFLDIMTLRPMELSAEHAEAALRSEVTAGALKDTIAVGTLFNIITRYASALDFAMPSAKEFDRAPPCCSNGAMPHEAATSIRQCLLPTYPGRLNLHAGQVHARRRSMRRRQRSKRRLSRGYLGP